MTTPNGKEPGGVAAPPRKIAVGASKREASFAPGRGQLPAAPAPPPGEPPDPGAAAQAALFGRVASIGLDLILVSQFEFRDADGELVHREQREDRLTGAPAERAQAAIAATRGAAELRERWLRRADAERTAARARAREGTP